MEKNEPFHSYTYYILCCLALSFSLSLFLEFSKERMQLSALLFPHSDDLRESCITQILLTEICETDINMYTCCCPSQACLNLLFFWGKHNYVYMLSSFLTLTCLFHRPAVAARCVSAPHLSQYCS